MIILAIHGGCGTFSRQIDMACSSALKTTIKGRKQEENSQLVKAIMELEKCPNLNSGNGSNLTEIGNVECEASFICSTNLAFGAIASVTNCIHPIYAAFKLADFYRHKNSNFTPLIEPMILVGPGADEFCRSKSIGIVKNTQLITEAAKMGYNRAKCFVESSSSSSTINNGDLRLDTVGGVLINMLNGYAEAGVSSGGILLKKCGRLGHSPHFGAAVWAEQRESISIAISLSGCGEAIIRTQMAEKLAQFMFESDLDNPFLPEFLKQFLDSNFLNSSRLSIFPRDRLLLGGLLLIKNGPTIGLMCFHNSRHFPFAYVRTNQKIGKLKSETDKCGEFVCISMNL